jgi:hypothetical protein
VLISISFWYNKYHIDTLFVNFDRNMRGNRLVAGMRDVHAFLVKRGAGESGARASSPADRGAGVLACNNVCAKD